MEAGEKVIVTRHGKPVAQIAPPPRLPAPVRTAILAGPNFFSVVSYWEVVLKSRKGSLDVGDPRAWWTDALEQLAATPLPLRPEHIAEVSALPPLHKDPFDRVLVAQAAVEGLKLVTADGEIPRYASARVKIVH